MPDEHATDEHATIGVIGGSGFSRFVDDVMEVSLTTPWGAPSAPIHLGTLGDRRIAFLPRHGPGHTIPPHRVNARANLWAMRELGVERIFGPCAAGSLRADLPPGTFVLCDQLVDRTSGRPDTYFDGPAVNHVSFADPYCPELRAVLLAGGEAGGIAMHPTGTVVVVQGPRFSTRAESRSYRQAGWEVINMTQYPEAYLARELGICYATVALVTDFDTGVEDEPGIEPVDMATVFDVMRDNVERVRALLERAIVEVPVERSCSCASAPGDVAIVPPASS
jgi:5'-methylthioadenosine phosphorylase